MAKYANIIVDISIEKLDRPFQYRIPEHLREGVREGSAVMIPFGKGNRVIKGYVLSLTDTPQFQESALKEIIELSKGQIDIESHFIALAWWMKNRYGSTMIQAMKTVMPVKAKVQQVQRVFLRPAVSEETLREKKAICERKHYKAQARLLEALLEEGVLEQSVIKNKLNITASTVNALEKQGLILSEYQTSYRNPITSLEHGYMPLQLNEEQQYAVDTLWQDYCSGEKHTWLLYGITGSGKTEVYLELIEKVLKERKQIIVLIPEISLTYQTVMRFYKRFGNRISIVNSRMSAGERYDQFLRAKSGEIDIMIGPRSALFTPFERLGLIVVDEEHEDSYKSDSVPKYHAREVAIKRAEMAGGMVVLGSATPSLESNYMAEQGVFKKLTLTSRGVLNSVLPAVEIVDLRKEMAEGNRSILSRSLHEKIADRLRKKEQVMLFLNRRGYANFMSCRSCGEVIKCPHCDISLTLHEDGSMRCHYCGHTQRASRTCPFCGLNYVAGLGIGTEKAVALVKEEFPDARILRMDLDSTSKKGSMEEILSAFANEEADILLGTQMIVKGHDFRNVTLVGILVADRSLNASSYRACERTFQLLTQAAGRAGRGEKNGEVIIQTYRPEHYAIETAARQDYDEFYTQELSYRKMLGYPPISRMMSVLVTAPKQEDAAEAIEACAALIRTEFAREALQVTGPAPDVIGKINDLYRRVLFVRSSSLEILQKVKNRMDECITVDKWYQLVVQCDFS